MSHISCVASAGGYLSKNITDIHSIYTLQTARPHRERKATSQKYKSAAISKVSGGQNTAIPATFDVSQSQFMNFESFPACLHFKGCYTPPLGMLYGFFAWKEPNPPYIPYLAGKCRAPFWNTSPPNESIIPFGRLDREISCKRNG